jgi:leucyl-tRNA synthetase
MSEREIERYEPATIEAKWQKYWEENRTFAAVRRPGHPKAYILDMFPYPSGAGLHVGHPEGYTATDIMARFRRMNGYDVLHPMGWDAFGLPAEQYAIQTGTHPRVTTLKNIDTFRRQLKALGFSYDWDREVDTTDAGYVKWTQWIFLQLFKKGLAFQDEIPVNWCAELGTVLANEEVIDGKSERGGYPVKRVPLRQWMLRITSYADRLDSELDASLDWPETREKQRHWIGRSEGAEATFAVDGDPSAKITVFTTRVDTLPGVSYVVVAPEHPLLGALTVADQKAAVDAYVQVARNKSDRDRADASKEKSGVPTGSFAINPINGDKVPVWVADYVIGSYGTGAVMGVPAHDDRDHAFARKYSLPITQVVAPVDGSAVDVAAAAFTDDGVAFRLRTHVAIADGVATADVKKAIVGYLTANSAGKARITYRLRDWVFSRQRYWGEPIPVYFPVDAAPGVDPRADGATFEVRFDQPIAVDESELPLKLPELDDFKPGDDPAGPLARAKDWRFFQKDGKWFARETNTMPQWAGSCWYYLRFIDPKNETEIFSQEAYDSWMPVDLYVGGSEHAVLHLLYARFWHKALFDIGVVKHREPFIKLVHQGMILGEMEHLGFKDSQGNFVSSDLVVENAEQSDTYIKQGDPEKALLAVVKFDIENLEKKGQGFVLKSNPEIRVLSQSQKMSKSRGNVINPDDIIKKYGADALRGYEMFMGPLEAVKPWQTNGVEGVRRFLDRVFVVGTGTIGGDLDDETKRLLHKTIAKVGQDIEAMRFNTAISAMMILVKHLGALPAVPKASIESFAQILSPFAPHLAEEIWERLGHKTSIALSSWPTHDPALLVDAEVEIAVQVNGKVRAAVKLARDASEDTAKEKGLADAKVAEFVTGKTIKKVVYVPGRILNFIVA